MDLYLQDYQFLKELDSSSILDVLAKITILDMNEKPIAEIQGRTLGGQINITNSSSVRRTGNISFLPDERYSNLMDVNQLISLNKKIKIEIGYLNNTSRYNKKNIPISFQSENNLDILNWGQITEDFSSISSWGSVFISEESSQEIAYEEEPYYPIFWFPLGIFGITGVSESESTQGHTYSIDFQDKMAFLNGTCGGTIPATVSLDTDSFHEKLPIYVIIMEAVSHFGQEQKGNIIIEGIDLRTRNLLKWKESETDTIYIDSTIVAGYEDAAGWLTTALPVEGNQVDSFAPGENIGYEFTSFVFPSDLIAEAGSSVADLLEKIKTTLGNYEYFYDIYGQFHFREIKNYLNTSLSTETIEKLSKDDYLIIDSSIYHSDTIYNFDGGDLIINLNHSPNYSEIKNDFVVWGSRKVAEDLELPIRYHLAIDKKPIPTEIIGNKLEDWRNVLYRQGQNANELGLYSNYYYSALVDEWPKLYNIATNTWHTAVLAQPENIDYFLDFIDTESQLNELDIRNIGRRTKVINNSSINCLFAPELPQHIIIKEGDVAAKEEAILKGYEYVVAPVAIYDKIVLGTNYLDAFSVVRELLHQHTQYNSTITLQTLPIYHLDVNRLISIFYQDLNINGKFIINSITLPLSVNETMSINASAALKRI